MSTEPLQQQSCSPLLSLPPEIRNQIYDEIAHSKTHIEIRSGDKIAAPSAPLARVCRQLQQEFSTAYQLASIASADQITIRNANFQTRPLLLTLDDLPAPAAGISRYILVRIHLTDGLQIDDITTFVTRLAFQYASPTPTESKLQYTVSLDLEGSTLQSFRVVFAKLAKRYRFHRCDTEQRIWEQIYWSFAAAAEKVDGVSVRQYALGQWKSPGEGFCFV